MSLPRFIGWIAYLYVGLAALVASNLSLPERIAYAVVLFIGVPSMLRNWTAVALVGSFLVVHFVWTLTEQASLTLDFMCDYAVVFAIFLKVDLSDCSPFGGLWRNGRACWGGLPVADRIVLGLFLPAWAASIFPLSAIVRYWIMWVCGVAQFLVAGVEAFATWRRGRAATGRAKPRGGSLREGLALPFPYSRAVVL